MPGGARRHGATVASRYRFPVAQVLGPSRQLGRRGCSQPHLAPTNLATLWTRLARTCSPEAAASYEASEDVSYGLDSYGLDMQDVSGGQHTLDVVSKTHKLPEPTDLADFRQRYRAALIAGADSLDGQP